MTIRKTQLSFKQALQKIASYCAYQERCKQEVVQKLKIGITISWSSPSTTLVE